MISMADIEWREGKEEHLESKTKAARKEEKIQKWKEHKRYTQKPPWSHW